MRVRVKRNGAENLSSSRSQECPQRSLDILGQRRIRCVLEEPRRRAVRIDEGGAALALGDMRIERRADVVCQHALEVIHQEVNPRDTDDVRHGRTPTRSLR